MWLTAWRYYDYFVVIHTTLCRLCSCAALRSVLHTLIITTVGSTPHTLPLRLVCGRFDCYCRLLGCSHTHYVAGLIYALVRLPHGWIYVYVTFAHVTFTRVSRFGLIALYVTVTVHILIPVTTFRCWFTRLPFGLLLVYGWRTTLLPSCNRWRGEAGGRGGGRVGTWLMAAIIINNMSPQALSIIPPSSWKGRGDSQPRRPPPLLRRRLPPRR